MTTTATRPTIDTTTVDALRNLSRATTKAAEALMDQANTAALHAYAASLPAGTQTVTVETEGKYLMPPSEHPDQFEVSDLLSGIDYAYFPDGIITELPPTPGTGGNKVQVNVATLLRGFNADGTVKTIAQSVASRMASTMHAVDCCDLLFESRSDRDNHLGTCGDCGTCDQINVGDTCHTCGAFRPMGA